MTDFFTPAGPRSTSPAPPSRPVQPRRGSRLPALLAAAAVAATAVGSVWWWTGRPPSELRLPDTLVGLSVAPYDFGAGPEWSQAASETGLDVVGRGFGGDRSRRPLALNVLVVGGDATGELDFAFEAGSSTRIGRVSCTQTLDFGADLPDGAGGGAGPKPSESSALCWRTSRQLSVSVLVLGTDPSYLPTAAQAVQQVWDLQE